MELTWLGRSCFRLITRRRTSILFDPYLERCRENGVSLQQPDMVCVSHGHLDHFADVPDLVRGDSPTLVVAIPRLCRALRELLPETRYRLFPIPWGDHVEVQSVHFYAFRSPPMQTSVEEMRAEFGEARVQGFLKAFGGLGDEILYLPLTSFGVEANGLRVLHFVAEGVGEGESVDVRAVGAQFEPDVALVGVNPGEEARDAMYAAFLGAPLVIPHHYHAYGELPKADLEVFARRLRELAPSTCLQVPDVMETIRL